MLNTRFRDRTNTWPAFVDLFSNLVIILIFLLIVFVFLWTTTSVFNKRSGAATVAELKQANASQAETIAQMTADEEEAKRLLLMARSELETLSQSNTELTNELTTVDTTMDGLIDEYESKIATLTQQLNQANLDKQQVAALVAERRQLQEEMSAQRATLNDQLVKLQSALDAAEEKSNAQEIRYVEMSTRLNRALADKVAELKSVSQYQSAFYKAIKLAMGDRTTLQPDGDRFIVSSDILFNSGSYKLSAAGREQLKVLAGVIRDMENQIPSDIDWIIRVDGHTDKKAVVPGTRGYKNNTELSLLRATAVVNELAKNGVSPRRLVPSGFGDMHPVALGNDTASLQQNRRIELQLTNR